jgi:high-affinity nickel-transport protein
MNPSYWFLSLYALALGMRHGLDLDHIATIDAMTRQVAGRTSYAPWVGCLFSLGHGMVVLLISLGLSLGFYPSMNGAWLEPLGEWIAIFFLILFGTYNLMTLNLTELRPMPRLVLKRWNAQPDSGHHPLSPLRILGIGALFACSFDTFTQISLFSLSAHATSKLLMPLILSLFFMLGMVLVDGLNGWLIKTWIQTLASRAPLLWKVSSLLIALFSLGLGIQGIMKQLGVRHVWSLWM